jgi:diacylglycerol kinase
MSQILDRTDLVSKPQRANSFLRSLVYAFRGIWSAFKSERNLKIHSVALCLVIALGVSLGLAALEWGLVIFALGFVFVTELINTAVERIGDKAANGKMSHTIGTAKDISAAAVLISALTALAIGIIFLIIPLVQKIF